MTEDLIRDILNASDAIDDALSIMTKRYCEEKSGKCKFICMFAEVRRSNKLLEV